MEMTIRDPENTFIFPAISAIVICLGLFYVDEGYMDLSWMSSVQNWLIFLLYTSGFFLGLAIITTYVTKGSRGWKKKGLIYLLGLPLAIPFVMLFMYFGTVMAAICQSIT